MTKTQIILTGITIFVALIVDLFVEKYILKLSLKNKYRSIRKKMISRLFKFIIFIAMVVSILLIWGIAFQNLWITLTSVLAIVAIGFVAVWSMLSNILASIIIFFTKPFKFGDEIKIMPDDIGGKVVSIGLIFTTLKDKNKIINIPNNLVMQRVIIKNIKNK